MGKTDDLAAAMAHFRRADPLLYKASRKILSKLSPRKRVQGASRLFAALAESVVSQQLSVKASDTIWKRLEAACGGSVTPEAVLALRVPKMRACGLSAAKAKTLKELAKAVQSGLDLPSLRKKSPEEASAALTNVWGIGPWTAEMFLMFGLGHPDTFSARDLGLVRSMEALYGIEKDSPLAVYETFALKWSPHRTTACRILWRLRDS